MFKGPKYEKKKKKTINTIVMRRKRSTNCTRYDDNCNRNCLAYSMESDRGCTPRMYRYFDNMMLTSQKPCQFDCSETNGHNIPQHAINEIYVCDFFSIKIEYHFSDILLETNINFIYTVDRIMDFNRAEPKCCRTKFSYASSG